MDSEPTASDVIAERVRELRNHRKWTVRELAARCAAEGSNTLTTQALYKLEGQRDPAKRHPRPVTVDELLVLARALGVRVRTLLAELDGEPEGPVLYGIDSGQLGQLIEGLQVVQSFTKWVSKDEWFGRKEGDS